MMNYFFVCRVTSSVLISLFTLSFGISNVKSVNAQDTSSNQKIDCSIPSRLATKKLRIAVADITIAATNLRNSNSISNSEGNITRIADTVASKLAKENNFIVVERTQIKNLYDKRNLCDIRSKFGVEAVIIGSITRFDIDTRTSGRSFLGFGKKTSDKNAYVELNIRIINTATNEIIDYFTETGVTSFSESQALIPRITLEASNNNDYRNTLDTTSGYSREIYDVNGTKFSVRLSTNSTEKIRESTTTNEGSLMTLATKEAINHIVARLNTNYDKLISTLRKVGATKTLVAGTFGDYIVLNHGTRHGYRKGMKLVIKEVTKTVVDPQTKEVIRTLTFPCSICVLISSLKRILLVLPYIILARLD
ncbi:MAG: CsgG/HfaB family protein [Cyanobacteria bacterium J06635_10]